MYVAEIRQRYTWLYAVFAVNAFKLVTRFHVGFKFWVPHYSANGVSKSLHQISEGITHIIYSQKFPMLDVRIPS